MKKIVNVIYVYEDGSTSTVSLDNIVDNLLKPEPKEISVEDFVAEFFSSQDVTDDGILYER